MKKNYDIYNDDFNELSGNYKDLVNQPTMGDAFAEAFSKAGSNPTPGPQSAIANAILNGMGAGFKGSENMIRQQKLEPLYKMVAENTARAAEIRAQVQEAKQNELAFKKFADIATPTVAAWAEQVKNGDPRSNITFTGLIDQLSRTVPQFNKYTADHWNTAKGFGLLLNKETGEHLKISADEIMQAVAPRAKEVYGDRWFEKFDGLSAGLAKDAAYALNMQRQEDALGLEGKRADVNLKQAHAGVYQKQANQIQNEMQAPKPKYDDKTLTHNRTQNSDWVNSLYKKHKDLKGVIKAQTEIKDAIQKEIDNNSWNTGSSFFAELTRWANEKSGDNQTQQLIALKRQPLFKELKNIFPTRITDVDLATWLTTQVDLSTDPKLAISELKSRIEESQDEIKEEEIRREVLENDFGNSEPYNSLLVDQKVQEKVKSNTGMVTMTGPAGTIKVPADKVELFKANGYQ